jgi:purine-binding chemotaxis protein CheW
LASTPTIASSADDAAAPFAGFGVAAAPAFPDETPAVEPAARLLLFGVNDRVCACEIGEVREIIPFRRITRLPGAPAAVLGLINLRGSVLTVLDLGVRLGGAPVDRTLGSIVLVQTGERTVGLAVSDVRDVQPVAAEALEEAREGADRSVVRGLAHVSTTEYVGSTASAGLAPPDDAPEAPRDVGGAVVVLLDVQSIIRHALL